MPGIFGNQATGDLFNLSKDYCMGSLYTCPEVGVAESISVFFHATAGGGKNFKAGLYKKSDKSWVANTGVGVSVAGTWVTLDITDGGVLEATDYFIVVWLEEAEVTCDTYDGTSAYDSEVYGNPWPNPWDETAWGTNEFPFYCTYSVPSGAAPMSSPAAALIGAGVV
ncbi:hypothetical protein ES703_89402 [subsurface metagenome]